MGSRTKVYFLFVGIGLIITTANLILYASVSTGNDHRHGHNGRKLSTNGVHHGLQSRIEDALRSIRKAGGPGDNGSNHTTKAKGVAGGRVEAKASTHHDAHKVHPDGSGAAIHKPPPTMQPTADPQVHPARHHHRGAVGVDNPSQAPPHHQHHQGPIDDTSANHHHQKKHAEPSNGGKAVHRPAATPKRRHAYVASEADWSFANMSYGEALESYHQYLLNPTEDIEQSSNKFRDIEEHSDAGVRLPTSDEELQEMFGLLSTPTPAAGAADYCDPRSADYTAATDEACIRYLSDVRNMLSIKPMSSILSSGRTIKFKVYYKDNNVTAVVKVSQKKFALEPASEVIALYVDRWLEFQRVPPVAWAAVPQDFLRAACATMDAFYAKWFDRFVIHYDTTKHLSSTCFVHTGGNGERVESRCLNVSIQLWMADVHNAEETVLRPSEAYRKYLELPPPADALATVQERLQKTTSSGESNAKYVGLAELMDEFIFDLIIGNTDRWFGHNSFALGGCTPDVPCGRGVLAEKNRKKPSTRSTMRLAFIDQGSSFYRKGAPDMNPFAANYDRLCRFRRRTLDRVLALMPEGTSTDDGARIIFETIRPRIPSGVFGVHNIALFKAAGSRMATLAAHMRKCLVAHNATDVRYFD